MGGGKLGQRNPGSASSRGQEAVFGWNEGDLRLDLRDRLLEAEADGRSDRPSCMGSRRRVLVEVGGRRADLRPQPQGRVPAAQRPRSTGREGGGGVPRRSQEG